MSAITAFVHKKYVKNQYFVFKTVQAALNMISVPLGICLSLMIIWTVETRFFPVVTEFDVTHIRVNNGRFYAYGAMHKERQCETVGVNIYVADGTGERRVFSHRYQDYSPWNTTLGAQSWGPILLHDFEKLESADSLYVSVLYRCHAFWYQGVESRPIRAGNVPILRN